MPKCALVNCASQNKKKQPNLSFHRLSRNPYKQKLWLEAIGSENLKQDNIKDIFLCSLHFKENDFNKTLDVIRLRDDALPSLFIQEQELSYQCLDQNNYDQEKCQAHFDNYNICKKFWGKVYNDRRRKGIIPHMPDVAEREQVKQEYINARLGR